MKFSDFANSMSNLEIVTLVIFIVYLVYPFDTPLAIANIVNMPIGLVGIFIVTLYLFFYTNPILGVVYLFVAYELIRRSALAGSMNAQTLVKFTPSEDKRQAQMEMMNPVQTETLEEEVILKMAPAQQSFIKDSDASTFKPVYSQVVGASLV